jgi:hypothetical protein
MDFITVIYRKSNDYWLALCLENGLVGQGLTKEEATRKLKESISSFVRNQLSELMRVLFHLNPIMNW